MTPPLFATEKNRPRSVHAKMATKAVREKIRRNPVRKQKILSREIKIAPRTMPRILKDNLELAAYIGDTMVIFQLIILKGIGY